MPCTTNAVMQGGIYLRNVLDRSDAVDVGQGLEAISRVQVPPELG